jgi:hypothetical protein
MSAYDELELLFGQGEPLEEGSLLPLPSMPLLAPPPPRREPSVAAMVERGEIVQKATGEPPEPAERHVAELRLGDTVELPDGRTGVVSWIDPRGKRVGIGKGKNKLFLSASEAQRISGRKVASALNAARQRADEQEGRSRESTPAVMPTHVSLPPGLNLLPHQLENIEFLARTRGRGLIADEPGLGKTISAVIGMETPAVVVCPSLLKVNWVRELNRWRPELTVIMVEGTETPRARQGRPGRPLVEVDADMMQTADVVVINYDVLYAHVGRLRDRGNKTIVSDESHYLKNLDLRWNKTLRQLEAGGPRRTRAFHELQKGVDRLVLLTGTPIMNRTKELFPLLHMLDPDTWGSPYRFFTRYCAGHYDFLGPKRVFKCDGRSNSEELHERINGTYMMRHTKESELANLPPKQRFSKVVSLSPHYQKEYHKARNEFLSWLSEQDEKAVGRALAAQALVKLTALRGLAALGKAEAITAEIVDFFVGTQRPLVVMAHHRSAIERIVEGIDAANAEFEAGRSTELPRPIRYGMVLGGMSEKQRQAAIDAFQRGELDVIFHSISIAVGVTLTRAADMYFVERIWRPADQVQAEDRIHRVGQEQKVTITYFDAEGTIDLALAAMLADKAKTSAAVIDGQASTEQEAAQLIMGDIMGLVGPAALRGLVSNRAAYPTDDSGPVPGGPPVRLCGADGERFDGYEYDDHDPEYAAWADSGLVETSWADPI